MSYTPSFILSLKSAVTLCSYLENLRMKRWSLDEPFEQMPSLPDGITGYVYDTLQGFLGKQNYNPYILNGMQFVWIPEFESSSSSYALIDLFKKLNLDFVVLN